MSARRIGDYVLEEVLGQGGMGTVFRARHVELGVTRALKLLGGQADPVRSARFEREWTALARVEHPGVVRIHEAGESGGALYYVMSLVEGEPLDRLLERGRLPLERALELTRGVAEAVEALHEAGIVHRDLKPANVVLTPAGRPVVIDLGLAIDPAERDRLTRTGAFVGTVATMAPEQVRGEAVSPATDVFALGRILYELVTGESALPGGLNTVEALARVLHSEAPLPSERDPQLPAELDAIVARACALAAPRRFARAGELAAALAELDPAARSRGRGARGSALALLAATAALAALGGVLTLGPWRAEAPVSSSPPPSPLADPSPSLRDARVAAQAGARLRELRRLPPRARAQALAAWLASFPDAPQREEAASLQRETWREAPAAVVKLEGLERGLRVVYALERRGERLFARCRSRDQRNFLACWSLRGELLLRWERAPGEPTLDRGLALVPGGFLVGSPGALYEVSEAGEVRQRWALPLPRSSDAVAASPSGRTLACAQGDGSVLVCPRSGGEALRIGEPLTREPPALDAEARFLDEDTLLVAAGRAAGELNSTSVLRLFRRDEQGWSCADRRPLLGTPKALALSSDGRRAALTTSSQLVYLFAPGGPLRTLPGPGAQEGAGRFMNADSLRSHRLAGAGVVFGPRDELLYSTAAEVDHPERGGELAVWEVAGGTPRRHLQVPTTPVRACLSGDGRWLYVITLGGEVELWATE